MPRTKKGPRLPQPSKAEIITVYTISIAQGLNLQGWDISVDFALEDCEEGTLAEVDTTAGQYAVITIYPTLLASSPEELRLTLVHELCHVLMDRINKLVDVLTASRDDVLTDISVEAIEHSTEMFARLLAPGFPLPPT